MATPTNDGIHFIAVQEVIKSRIMAHINPVFVIASSELEIGNGQDRRGSNTLKGSRPGDPEGSAPYKGSREFKNMLCNKWKWSYVFNTAALVGLGFMVVALELNIIPFRSLGYQCNDPNLSRIFRGDTITFACIVAVSLLLPLLAVFVVELVASIYAQTYRNSLKKRTLWLAFHWYGRFFLGLLILLFLVQLGKSMIAEPRPHFFDTCKPDKFNCTGYVTEFHCTNEELAKRYVRDSYRSFPSGHSALGFYVAIFLCWFFQSRIPSSDYLVVPMLQTMLMAWAVVCSLTRITDYQHHWWDVLIGSVLGIVMAGYTSRILCRNFRLPGSGKSKNRNLRDGGNNVNNWYKRMFKNADSNQQTEDKELREIK